MTEPETKVSDQTKSEWLSIALEPGLKKALDIISTRQRRTRSQVVRFALEEFIRKENADEDE